MQILKAVKMSFPIHTSIYLPNKHLSTKKKILIPNLNLLISLRFLQRPGDVPKQMNSDIIGDWTSAIERSVL